MASKGRQEGFEAVYRRLEETVAKLEEGGLTLEEAIALYEEGMKQAQRCQEMLEQAELRIARLQEAFAAYERASLREESPAYVPDEEEEELSPE